jgi:hypothetical protein
MAIKDKGDGMAQMLIEQVAAKLQTTPQALERDSLRFYLEKRLRTVESELLRLGHRYGVKTVAELDALIQQGRYHEEEAFEDYFAFDNLEQERDTMLEILESL